METPGVLKVHDTEFNVLRLLGHGKGGYSWLVSRDGKEYVIKQIHHEPCTYYTFGNKIEAELRDFHRLKEAGIAIPVMLDVDMQRERILKEYIPGPTVYDLVAAGQLPPVCSEQIRRLSCQARNAGLNLDWFPTNFIWHQNRLYYVDYECNDFMEEWSLEKWGIRYWTRTPEFLQDLNRRRQLPDTGAQAASPDPD